MLTFSQARSILADECPSHEIASRLLDLQGKMVQRDWIKLVGDQWTGIDAGAVAFSVPLELQAKRE